MQTPDMQKLEAFAGQMAGELAASIGGVMIALGDRLGLYKAMADGVPVTSVELAARTGCDERYLREWLSAQAAAGYLDYDKDAHAFSLGPEAAMVFAHEESPALMAGGWEMIGSMWQDLPKVEAAYRSGAGLGWHEHSTCLFRGVERFFRPGYNANLVENWIPALDGVKAKLEAGGRVADIGCGHGASTVLLARAFPQARFTGFDYHEPSIDAARERARAAGVAERCEFVAASAKSFPGQGYDLVAIFDALHDMGDPVGAARHVRQALAPDGVFMIVEPNAGDSLAENINLPGRLFYAASSAICTPASRAQEVGLALGAQAGQKRLTEVLNEAGFSRVRRAAETPFNMVLEARA